MTKRFLRLDLSSDGRDFEAVAMEPGLPLLDRTNANFRTLRKWLGRFAAEPEWHGRSVDLFVCDEQEGRMVGVSCEPIAAGDLQRNRELKQDLAELVKRLEKISPEPKEAALRKSIVRHFRKTIAEAGSVERDCHLFKYRDGGVWRLVWSWGYQRKDLEPGAATTCTNPDCNLLFFVRHSDSGRDCPGCVAAVKSGVRRSRSGLRTWAFLLIVALIAGALGYLFRDLFVGERLTPLLADELIVTPEQWVGPLGAQIRYTVIHRSADDPEEDVSTQVVVVAEDPKVAQVAEFGGIALARSYGKTAIHFYYGGKDAHATVEVVPGRITRLLVEPAEVTLGVGTTARLRVFGEDQEGKKNDLTATVEWEPDAGGNVYCYQGQLEGMTQGKATLVARYRATPNEPYLTTETTVTVANEEYKSLELSVTPNPVEAGQAARLEAYVTTSDNQKRSVLNSSLLDIQVTPSQLATIEGEVLQVSSTGAGKTGKLKSVFDKSDNLSAEEAFEIRSEDPIQPIFEVHPREMQMALGEIGRLQVTASSSEPIHLKSSDPAVVEVLPGRRIAARSAGKAEIIVQQEALEKKIPVTVKGEKIVSIAFVPDRISVPEHGSVSLRLVASCDDDRQFDLLPDQITSWQKVPTPAFAELDLETLELHGRAATDDSPQTLEARVGELRASAQVDVIWSPGQVELTPAGPVALHVGEVDTLRAVVKYGDGRRTEVSASKLQWKMEPPGVEGLELDQVTGTVRATKGGIGPVSVVASYHGSDSNPVEVRSLDDSFTLALESDRSVILVDNAGRFRAFGADGQESDLELEGVRFESSDEKVLSLNPQTGEYRALSPGPVTVTATHPNAKGSAREDFQVFSPDEVDLVLQPAEVQLLEGGRQPLSLELVAGDRRETVSLIGSAGSAQIEIPGSGGVEWEPPVLIGVSRGEPFEISASYSGKTARARVHVVSRPDQPKIRLVPAVAELSPGQPLSPRVEQQLPGADGGWQEVTPSEVNWLVPESVIWEPPADGLRPQLVLPDSASGEIEIAAEYGGAKATMLLSVKEPPPPPTPGSLSVVREPEGEELFVDQRQRYTVMVGTGEQQEPAVGTQWQPPFENDYIRWEPPYLTAKRQGHVQRLEASVGDQTVRWETRTVESDDDPFAPIEKPPAPEELRIVSDQPQPIVIPVPSDFADFRVEGVFPGDVVRDLTRGSTLIVLSDDPENVPLAVQGGQLRALRPGTATIQAQYKGVATSEGLQMEVIGDLPPEYSLEIQPASLEVPVGETRSFRVEGFQGTGDDRRSLGDVTNGAALKWSIDTPDVAQLSGPDLTGLTPGSATVTVRAGDASGSAAVVVLPEPRPGQVDEHRVVIQPDSISLMEGETVFLETGVTITQGGAAVGNRFQAVSSDPSIFSYNPNNRSISGVSQGAADLHVTVGASRDQIHVSVIPGPPPQKGKIVVEPSTGRLAVAEGQDLHVILVTDDGQRIDRTASALLEAANGSVLAVRGTQIVGLAPGTSEVTASLPGSATPGMATFLVEEVHPTRIAVTPPSLQLALGDDETIRIFGIGPRGRRELSRHPDLKVTRGGEHPDAIQWRDDSGSVRGIAPGQAELRVTWRDLIADPVPIEVSDVPPTVLRIEPTQATIEVGDRAPFMVFATRGSRQRNLTADDGVELQVGDTSVAREGGDLTVVGTSVGTTEVTARYGRLSAVALLHVGPPTGPPPGWTGLRFLPDILRLQLGVPGASVRVLRISADGRQEDIDHRANIDVADTDVVEVKWTASGPIFTPKKLGRTEATASQGNLTTRVPLQIHVVDPPPIDRARLEVLPNPMRLNVGDADEFRRVQLVPGNGIAPVNINYRVQSDDEAVVGVEGGKIMRGLSAGQAQVRVTPVDVGEQYEDLSANVTIVIEDDEGVGPVPLELVLTGPSQTTELAEVEYRAELVGGPVPRDVTDDGAKLVLDLDQQSLAEVQPGCNLIAKSRGTINVRARYNELISNVLQLSIYPPRELERVELEIDRRTLSVGESCPYRVWGYPLGGGPRHDLTGQAVAYPAAAAQSIPQVAIRVLEPSGGDIVSHSPPEVVARSVGKFQLAASLPPDLLSRVVDVEIVLPPSGGGLRVIPRSITVYVGESTPEIVASVRPTTGGEGRHVEAQCVSENEALVAEDPQIPGRFVGKAVGKTRIRATFGDLEPAFVDVTVKGDPFWTITLREEIDPRPGKRFAVTVDVEASLRPDIGLEYRLSVANHPEGGRWVSPTVAGDFLKASLTSPDILEGPGDARYNLLIEARDKDGAMLGSHPLSFSFSDRRIELQDP